MPNKTEYEGLIVNHPFNENIDTAFSTMEQEYGIDPFTDDGSKKVFESEVATEVFKEALFGNAITEESDREVISAQIDRSMEHTQRGTNPAFDLMDETSSQEGYDISTQVGSNNSKFLDKYNPAAIIGMNAKMTSLDIFKPMTSSESEGREIPFEFEVAYVFKDSDEGLDNKIKLPHGYRDGSLSGLLDPNKASMVLIDPDDNVTPGPNVIGIAPEDGSKGTPGLGFLKPKHSGNFISGSGKDRRDWGISEDPVLEGVVVDRRADTSTDATFEELDFIYIGAHATVQAFGGQKTHQRNLEAKFSYDVVDDTGKVIKTEEELMVITINRDTGDYMITSGGDRVKGLSFDITLMNVSNLGDPTHSGREVTPFRLVAGHRETIGVPLAYDTAMAKFRSGSAGTNDIVKYAVDKISDIFAMVNDTEMEKYFIGNVNNCINNPSRISTFPGYDRLGGWVGKETVDITQRGPGGGRALEWIEDMIKDVMTNLLNLCETDTEFNSNSDREWTFIGHKNNVRRFIDTRYKTENTEAQAGGSRFGFKKTQTYAYTDQFGDRIRFIGSTDRKWLNRTGEVYGLLRSNTPRVQPTAVYFGYDFRIIKSTHPRKHTTSQISFWAHDVWRIMTMVGAKITLNNPTNAINDIAKNSSLVYGAPDNE